jgi:hypothetical protein
LLAHAFLVVTRTRATSSNGRKGGRGGLTRGLGLLPLNVPEVRRLLVALVWTAPVQPGLVLAWSRWRDAIRPERDAHTTSDANVKCGWNTKRLALLLGAGSGAPSSSLSFATRTRRASSKLSWILSVQCPVCVDCAFLYVASRTAASPLWSRLLSVSLKSSR